MIMLDLPKDQMTRLEQASQQAGLTINDYLVSLINKHTKPNMQDMGELDRVFGRYNHYAKGKTTIEQMNNSIVEHVNEKWTKTQ